MTVLLLTLIFVALGGVSILFRMLRAVLVFALCVAAIIWFSDLPEVVRYSVAGVFGLPALVLLVIGAVSEDPFKTAQNRKMLEHCVLRQRAERLASGDPEAPHPSMPVMDEEIAFYRASVRKVEAQVQQRMH